MGVRTDIRKTRDHLKNKLEKTFRRRREVFLRGLYPHEQKLPEWIRPILEKAYPGIRLDEIRLYNTLPWFMAFSSRKFDAATLPSTGRSIKIFHNRFNLDDPFHLAILFHEYYHAWDFQLKGNKGLGFFKLYIIHYLAEYFEKGYLKSHFEIPAYQVQDIFYKRVLELKKPNHEITPADLNGLDNRVYQVYQHFSQRQPRRFMLCGSFFIAAFISVLYPVITNFFRLFLFPFQRLLTRVRV